MRRLLDYLGLPFEPACLAFHENKRAVRTASSEQVRRPINRDGLDQWRPFEPWLGPLQGRAWCKFETVARLTPNWPPTRHECQLTLFRMRNILSPGQTGNFR